MDTHGHWAKEAAAAAAANDDDDDDDAELLDEGGAMWLKLMLLLFWVRHWLALYFGVPGGRADSDCRNKQIDRLASPPVPHQHGRPTDVTWRRAEEIVTVAQRRTQNYIATTGRVNSREKQGYRIMK